MFHCLVFLLQFWLRLSLSSAKCDGRTGIFWQTAHRWSMKKKKKITSDIHNPIFLMMDISHLMHGQQNHEYLMIQLSVKSEVSFFFTLFSASTKQGKCTKYVGNRNTCAILKCSFWKKQQVWSIYSLQKLCQMVGFIYRPIFQLQYYGFWFSAFYLFPSAIHTSLLETLCRKIT